MNLFVPEVYRKAKPDERSRYCNGCGGAATGRLSRLVNWFIPQSIWGIRVRPACDIHDWSYAHGLGKKRSDLMFLFNLLILCSAGSRWLFPLRAVRCLVFYLAVTMFGRRFYGRKIAAKVMRRSRGRG